MKRVLGWVLALVLFAAAGAGAEVVALKTDSDGWSFTDRLLSDGETLYLVGGAGIGTWRPGDSAPTTWADGVDLPALEGESQAWRSGPSFYLDGGALCGGRVAQDGDSMPCGLQLCDLALRDGALVNVNAIELGLPKAVRARRGFEAHTFCADRGTLYLLGLSDEGFLLCGAGPESVFSLELEGWDWRLVPAPGGPLLVNVDEQSGAVSLSRVRGNASIVSVAELPAGAGAFAADPASGTVYCVLDGQVRPVDPEGGALGDAVAALPDMPKAAAVVGGRYAALMNRSLVVVDVDAPLDGERVVTVRGEHPGPWLEDALADFGDSCSGFTARYARDVPEDLMGALLTRSADADVFLLRCGDDGALEAVLKRGYALPLGDSAALTALWERLYPGIRERLGPEGAPSALPVSASGHRLGVNEALLNRMALFLTDVPGNWAGFLDFIEDVLPGRVSAFGKWDRFTYDMSEASFRWFLTDALLTDWAQDADARGELPVYDDPELVALAERIEGLDLSGFTFYPDEDSFFRGADVNGHSWSATGGFNYLIQFATAVGFRDGDKPDNRPLPLGFGDGEPGTLPLELICAVVNPYTPNPDAAVKLVEALARHVPDTTLYALCPDLTEPLRREDANQEIARWQGEIARATAELESAPPEERQALEGELDGLRAALTDYEDNDMWLIPRARLDWYREHDDRVTPMCAMWLNADDTGEAAMLRRQYDAGLIDAKTFLGAVARKVRMAGMEGG